MSSDLDPFFEDRNALRIIHKRRKSARNTRDKDWGLIHKDSENNSKLNS